MKHRSYKFYVCFITSYKFSVTENILVLIVMKVVKNGLIKIVLMEDIRDMQTLIKNINAYHMKKKC